MEYIERINVAITIGVIIGENDVIVDDVHIDSYTIMRGHVTITRGTFIGTIGKVLC